MLFWFVDTLFSITAKILMGTICTLASSLCFLVFHSLNSSYSDLCTYHYVPTTPARVTQWPPHSERQQMLSMPLMSLPVLTQLATSLWNLPLVASAFLCFFSPLAVLLKFTHRLLYCCLPIWSWQTNPCLHPDLHVNSKSPFPPALDLHSHLPSTHFRWIS